MNIREATVSDIPEIISVLKASLGEEDLPLSREIWNYKHIHNPFGKSLVLIAVEDERIVGVRAFMRWKWQMGNTDFSAVRAVDTATHPDFQGKGIFKKLTMEAVGLSINYGDNFVFNTPNNNSRPGYLKMGWRNSGIIKVGIKPAWRSFFKVYSANPDYIITKKSSEAELNFLSHSWNLKLSAKKKLFTPKSANYLSWRYENNPLQQYQVYADENVYLAGYVKQRKKVKELRIAECITGQYSNNKEVIKEIIKIWEKKFGVQITTFSGEMKALSALSLNSRIGPILTVRELKLSLQDQTDIYNIDNWAYSLGDLELF